MNAWQGDVLARIQQARCETELFSVIESAAQAMGFDQCSYGIRMPLPLSNPRIVILSSYCQAWQERYAAANYWAIDPTVAHARRSQAPVVWRDCLFASTPQLWDEAQSFGLKVGWAQSSIDAQGVAGMLSLARGSEALTLAELEAKESHMRWLVTMAHEGMVGTLGVKNGLRQDCVLTPREIEIFKWTADGKTAIDISEILNVSENTVKFHIKNAVSKLDTSNKTAAVVRAAMLGWLA